MITDHPTPMEDPVVRRDQKNTNKEKYKKALSWSSLVEKALEP